MTGAPALGGLREAIVPDEDWRELRECPACGSAGPAPVAAVEGGSGLAACAACELVFMARRPSAEWFDEFYAGDWDEGGRRRAADPGFTPEPSTRALDFCAGHLPSGAAVLDAGAGFGHALLGFRAAGHEPHALEASAHRAAFLRDRLGIETWSDPIEAVEPGRTFDLVYLQHVLEHVADPRAALSAARGLLAPGGLLYVAVPNLWDEHPPQTLHFVPHQSSFTARALAGLVERSGFELLRSAEAMELQMLARRRDDGAGAATGEPSSSANGFEERAADWARDGFRLSGRRGALVWTKSHTPGVQFDVAQVAGRFAAALVTRAHGLEKRLPSAPRELLRRLAPEYVRAKTIRVLPVEISEGGDVPVVVRYEGRRPPVWVK